MLVIFLCFAIAVSKPYQFVHIPKTGGTALGQHFAQYYSEHIEPDTWLYRDGKFRSKPALVNYFLPMIDKWTQKCYFKRVNHGVTTRQANNAILVLRDPIERIVSGYNYWKQGSDMRPAENVNASIEYYIVNILRQNHSALRSPVSWSAHYKPMSDWIHEEDYAKTTVVLYNQDLNVVLRPLMKHLNITFKNKNITIRNKSKQNANVTLSSTAKSLVKRIYANDFELLHLVHTHPERFSAVIGAPIIPDVESTKIMKLIYITHIDDNHQRNKINELHDAFGSGLIVSWGNRERPECPFPNITCINVTLDKVRTYDWMSSGTGHEKALMWSMKNVHAFDRVWIMEEDVHYTDIDFLHQVVTFDYDRDLILHARTLNSSYIEWKALIEFLHKQWEPLHISDWSWAQLQFFGASKTMIKAMRQTYADNNNTLLFLETMWSTVARENGLKIGGWYSYFESFSKNFRTQPCYTTFPVPGLYHPAKLRNGSYINCSGPKRRQEDVINIRL